jgi:chromosomal replication initiator protein
MQKSNEQENEDENFGYSIVHHISKMESELIKSNSDSNEIFRQIENWLFLNPEVIENSRKRELVDQRRMVCFLLKQYTDFSLTAIGKIIGGKDHATVMYAIKTHKELYPQSAEYKYNTKKLIKIFKNLL